MGFQVVLRQAGALLLAPLTIHDIQEVHLQLKPHHIIAIEENVPLIRQALADIPKRQKRRNPSMPVGGKGGGTTQVAGIASSRPSL